jgi:hypothetical protein
MLEVPRIPNETRHNNQRTETQMNSKASLLCGLVLPIGLLATPVAFAFDSVVVGGTTYNCTNTCVVTFTSPTMYNIHDCCGGKVSWKEK